jgi:hypothetical protein
MIGSAGLSGLGILGTELCMWAHIATPEMVAESRNIISHPVVKAKPDSILGPSVDAGWFDRINCWVNDNPFLAGALVVAGYLVLRKR